MLTFVFWGEVDTLPHKHVKDRFLSWRIIEFALSHFCLSPKIPERPLFENLASIGNVDALFLLFHQVKKGAYAHPPWSLLLLCRLSIVTWIILYIVIF
jgi:hypothetical protein